MTVSRKKLHCQVCDKRGAALFIKVKQGYFVACEECSVFLQIRLYDQIIKVGDIKRIEYNVTDDSIFFQNYIIKIEGGGKFRVYSTGNPHYREFKEELKENKIE